MKHKIVTAIMTAALGTYAIYAFGCNAAEKKYRVDPYTCWEPIPTTSSSSSNDGVTTTELEDEAAEQPDYIKAYGSSTSPLRISLVHDIPVETDFAPGARMPLNARVQNEGEEDAWVFVEVSVSRATGAVLADGTKDPATVEYKVGDGWTEVEDAKASTRTAWKI